MYDSMIDGDDYLSSDTIVVNKAIKPTAVLYIEQSPGIKAYGRHTVLMSCKSFEQV